MSKSRWLLLGLAIPVLLTLALFWLLATAPKDHIDKNGFDKLEIGMSRTEVEEILGGPNGNHATGKIVFDKREGGTLLPAKRSILDGQKYKDGWQSDRAYIVIGFDDEHKLTNASLSSCRPDWTNVPAWLRYWIGM